MTVQNSFTTLWFLGIEAEDARRIEKAAGANYLCRSLDDLSFEALSTVLDDGAQDDPLLIWMGAELWRRMRTECPEVLRHLEQVPLVLVVEARPDRAALEQVIDARVQQVTRSPLETEQIFDALSRAGEARNLYRDMTRMSREILMERELLERKSGICSFLFRFFEAAGEGGDARGMLIRFREAMEPLLPVAGLHVAWWDGRRSVVHITDSADGEEDRSWLPWPAGSEWPDRTKTSVADHDRAAPEAPAGRKYCDGAEGKGFPDRTVALPLVVRGVSCGLLVVRLREPFAFGKDAALALDAARRHLAVAFREGAGEEVFFAGGRSEDEIRDDRRPSVRPEADNDKRGKARVI